MLLMRAVVTAPTTGRRAAFSCGPPSVVCVAPSLALPAALQKFDVILHLLGRKGTGEHN